MSLHKDLSIQKNNTEAELIREACIKAAKEGFLDASISGLCHQGSIEAAISAIQKLDLDKLLRTNTNS